jgi:membrane-bound ClpP family serine protease
MSSLVDFYARVYAWISTAPVPLLVVLTCILLVTVPAAVNAVVAGVVGLIRGLLRLFGHDARAGRTGPFRHPASQLISLILLLSWAS